MAVDTPMMRQYHRIKGQNKDSILLFRLGDFYEMFEQDAVIASGILNITLTKRNNVPMCGFPYHAADTYIAKLLQKGLKIAICEQQEDPEKAKGIVKREVVETISPGIIFNPDLLKNNTNNCIATVLGDEKKGKLLVVCASLDVSTGEFTSIMFNHGDVFDWVQNEIKGGGIREIIYPASCEETHDRESILKKILHEIKKQCYGVVLRGVDDYLFEVYQAREVLKNQFSVTSPEVMELQYEIEVKACGALLAYVKENIKRDIPHIRWVKQKGREHVLVIDNDTRQHLELTENQIDGSENNTLLWVLDHTRTAMGGRLLKKYIHTPSRNLQEIRKRLDKVEYFFNLGNVLDRVRNELSRVLDIERIVSKLSVGKGNARDLLGLKNSLLACAEIKKSLSEAEVFKLDREELGEYKEVIHLIESGIENDPPPGIKEGGIIKKGFDKKLDELRETTIKNREWINHYQLNQQRKLGINSLKVRYNKIIGYYIEVTKPNLHLVPSSYIKKQTLVNAERFTTEELEKHQTQLMEVRENANNLEYSLFEDIRSRVLKWSASLYRTAEAVARIDVFASLAVVAKENSYVRPEVVEESIIDIRGGRHPVIEKLSEETFIENDLLLDDSERRVMILTGPNMSGKSTFLRQCALIIIMAQMGSFVPAGSATIGLVDRVFSRIGMSDRLVKGESTFLVEMIETSRILHYATKKSFIIMDEIGRGTSTYDGLAIAWAVLEHLLDERYSGAKVIFATHYHEITSLRENYGVINYNATVKEWNNSIVFLRKIVPGSASRSYGIEVAKMAGIPENIINRARSILHQLETNYGDAVPLLFGKNINVPQNLKEEDKEGVLSEQNIKEKLPVSEITLKKDNEKIEKSNLKKEAVEKTQLDLFPSPLEVLARELKGIDINSITPIEALNILDRLKKSINF